MEWSVDNFNVDEDGFSPQFEGTFMILDEPFRGGWSTIIDSQGDGGWY
jgi:hypothetical protein